MPFAQLFGNDALLNGLWQVSYVRDRKRAIEEIRELAAYAIILPGAIEVVRARWQSLPFRKTEGLAA